MYGLGCMHTVWRLREGGMYGFLENTEFVNVAVAKKSRMNAIFCYHALLLITWGKITYPKTYEMPQQPLKTTPNSWGSPILWLSLELQSTYSKLLKYAKALSVIKIHTEMRNSIIQYWKTEHINFSILISGSAVLHTYQQLYLSLCPSSLYSSRGLV